MSEEGQRIEFGGKGPYLFQVLDVEPQATLLEEHSVLLIQFGGLYLPVALDACKPLTDALLNLSQVAMGPEREGMIPVEFDLAETVELPLLTNAAGESFQSGEVVYLDVFFGETSARLCFTVPTVAFIAQVLSQVSAP